MLISELKDYMAEHRTVPVKDLAIRFDSDPEAIRAMLRLLIDRGRVRRLDLEENCDGCRKCAAYEAEVYQWVDRPPSHP